MLLYQEQESEGWWTIAYKLNIIFNELLFQILWYGIPPPPWTKIIRKRTKNTTQKKSSLCHINLDISEYWRIIDVTCMSQWKPELSPCIRKTSITLIKSKPSIVCIDSRLGDFMDRYPNKMHFTKPYWYIIWFCENRT